MVVTSSRQKSDRTRDTDWQHRSKLVGESFTQTWEKRRPQFVLRPLLILATTVVLVAVSTGMVVVLKTGYKPLLGVVIGLVSGLVFALIGAEAWGIFRAKDKDRNLLAAMTPTDVEGAFAARTFRVANSSTAVEFSIRLLDIAGAIVILWCSLPFILVTAVLIKVTSRGPVLYRGERVGKDGRLFTLYKFRTMTKDAEKQTGRFWTARDDYRITAVGRMLRRTRLDELPQLYNILRGDMSLVGPRPEIPFFVQRHKALQGVRLVVRPGMTGLAQIRSFYDLKPAHKVKYDYLYIQHRSFFLNLYILLQTIPVLFTKPGW